MPRIFGQRDDIHTAIAMDEDRASSLGTATLDPMWPRSAPPDGTRQSLESCGDAPGHSADIGQIRCKVWGGHPLVLALSGGRAPFVLAQSRACEHPREIIWAGHLAFLGAGRLQRYDFPHGDNLLLSDSLPCKIKCLMGHAFLSVHFVDRGILVFCSLSLQSGRNLRRIAAYLQGCRAEPFGVPMLCEDD